MLKYEFIITTSNKFVGGGCDLWGSNLKFVFVIPGFCNGQFERISAFKLRRYSCKTVLTPRSDSFNITCILIFTRLLILDRLCETSRAFLWWEFWYFTLHSYIFFLHLGLCIKSLICTIWLLFGSSIDHNALCAMESIPPWPILGNTGLSIS